MALTSQRGCLGKRFASCQGHRRHDTRTPHVGSSSSLHSPQCPSQPGRRPTGPGNRPPPRGRARTGTCAPGPLAPGSRRAARDSGRGRQPSAPKSPSAAREERGACWRRGRQASVPGTVPPENAAWLRLGQLGHTEGTWDLGGWQCQVTADTRPQWASRWSPHLSLGPVPHRGHPHRTPGTPFLTPSQFSLLQAARQDSMRKGGETEGPRAKELVRGAQTRGDSEALLLPNGAHTHGQGFPSPLGGGRL